MYSINLSSAIGSNIMLHSQKPRPEDSIYNIYVWIFRKGYIVPVPLKSRTSASCFLYLIQSKLQESFVIFCSEVSFGLQMSSTILSLHIELMYLFFMTKYVIEEIYHLILNQCILSFFVSKCCHWIVKCSILLAMYSCFRFWPSNVIEDLPLHS